MNKKNVYFIFFLVFVVFVFDGFTNTYIVLRQNYDERMLNYAGYCEKQGYGFYKKIIKMFDLGNNIPVKNFLDYPDPSGYFYDYQKKYSNNYLVLLNPKDHDLNTYKSKNFQIIFKENNCYLLKKND